MNAQLRQSNFTHGHCFRCNHIGAIASFDPQEEAIGETTGEGGVEIKANILELTCPICNAKGCEALFANEVN